MKRKIVACLLVAAMMAGSLVGCGKKEGGSGSKGAQSLVVASANFSQEFSPFFASSAYDMNIVDLTQVSLFGLDREGALIKNGIEGETVPYNGTDHTYTGIANMEINKGTDTTEYKIKIRDDIKFSDGEKLTIDDVIFSMYVFADPSYAGSSTFASLPIIGLENYQYNSTVTANVTDEEINKWISKNVSTNTDFQAKITEIMTKVLEAEFADCQFVMESEQNKKDYASYIGTAKSPVEIMVNNLGQKKLDAATLTDENIVAEVLKLYGSDYKKLSKSLVMQGDGTDTLFDADVANVAKTMLLEEKVASGEGKEVPNIEGIKKISDTEMTITTEGFDVTSELKLSIAVAPLHYYGSDAEYDYDNNKFGFTRGDLEKVKEKTNNPLGAGPYVYKKYENKIVYLEANEHYYKGAPKIKKIQYKETQDTDNIPGVQSGTIDAAEISGSKNNFEQIKGLNSNGETSGDIIYTNTVQYLGYGYIGMTADNVKVGNDGASEASKLFRKGLATVIAAYRDVSIDSYYGESASVIQYPISNTSWAAPRQSDPGYTNAYAVDVDGKQIYTDGMKAEEKYAAAAKAALGFFEKAGCTVKDGKVTGAPAGTTLKVEALIGAGGKSDHPSFGVLTDSKEALKKLGIELIITDLADPGTLFDKMNNGQAEIFVAAWGASSDPDMYQVYHSSMADGKGSNNYQIKDKELDKLIMKARISDNKEYRKATYKKCLDIIMDWGVEIPIYQREDATIFSSERVNTETLAKDITSFYSWKNEIEKLEMK
ncbi:MAG: ABC transporter substrate-binding protein [Lachnospiraceae bacterium]|nr:ABC transporter substrate-binding protein [Lachnospiraceae bacterium]